MSFEVRLEGAKGMEFILLGQKGCVVVDSVDHQSEVLMDTFQGRSKRENTTVVLKHNGESLTFDTMEEVWNILRNGKTLKAASMAALNQRAM